MITTANHRKDGFAIAALVLGILSLAFICLGPIAMLCGVVATALGLPVYGRRSGLGIAGAICGIVGFVLSLCVFLMIRSALNELPRIEKEASDQAYRDVVNASLPRGAKRLK